MKMAPLARVLRRASVDHLIVHTGQHYDENMSGGFFKDLGIPVPYQNLGVGSGSHATQTAAVMQRLEPILLESQPDRVVVYGDVNSTLAATLVAAKLGIGVGHVEAGLRSRDRSMPEEVNRVVTDRLADLLFTPSRDADENLIGEGVSKECIHFVGNIMIDSLAAALPAARDLRTAERLGLSLGEYVVVTMHRPSNVDDPETLATVMRGLDCIAQTRPVLFAVHPRTRGRLADLGIQSASPGLRLLDPLGYIEMLSLVSEAGLVITDSGGLQEETTFLGVPCLTVRPNTERPVTITHGTNRLVNPHDLLEAAGRAWSTGGRREIELWDGHAAERIARILLA